MPLEPGDYTVDELRDAEDGVTDADELEAAVEAEREGKDRSTAIEALESRLRSAQEADTAEEAEGEGADGGDDELAETAFIGPTSRSSVRNRR